MELTLVADGLGFPEGPVVCDDGSVLVVESRHGRITRCLPDGTKQIVAEPGGAPNGLAIGPDGALYCCNNGGFRWDDGIVYPQMDPAFYDGGRIERIDLSTGKSERLIESCDGLPLAGPNDIMFAADGSFWFTDLGKHFLDNPLSGGLFHAKIDGSVRAVARGIDLNGVGLSLDGATVYAAETMAKKMHAFPTALPEVGGGAGGMPEGRVIATLEGFLDSLAMEADGTIAQAVIGAAGGIGRIDPATGAWDIIPTGDPLTTNIAFGGPDMRTAYITLSNSGRLVKCDWPAAGLRLPFNI